MRIRIRLFTSTRIRILNKVMRICNTGSPRLQGELPEHHGQRSQCRAYHSDVDLEPVSAFYFYTDPDQAFNFDPDPAFHGAVNPAFTMMLIQIRLYTLMRIRIRLITFMQIWSRFSLRYGSGSGLPKQFGSCGVGSASLSRLAVQKIAT
jgi:hypothetical protein